MNRLGLRDTYDVVDKVIDAFHFWVPRLVVNVQGTENTDTSVCLNQTAARMGLQALCDDTVGNCDVGYVAVDRERFVSAPRDTDVIENHVFAVGYGYGVFTGVACGTECYVHHLLKNIQAYVPEVPMRNRMYRVIVFDADE